MRKGFAVPIPTRDTLPRWALEVHNFLRDLSSAAVEPQITLMQRRIGGEKATVDGLLMWDAAGYPTVSKGGVWREIVLADGYAVLTQDATINAAAADTAYALQFDTPAMAQGIHLDSTYPTRIVFEEAGLYRIAFTAQISSTSSSTVTFRFWPKVNGSNVSGSTMVNTLHNNGSTLVVSRDSIFQFAAGDYLEAMWSVSDTNGHLDAIAATGYAPASPSITLSISRVHQ